MKKEKTNRIRILLLAIVLLLACFLRVYKLPEIFVFGIDEEYQAYLAQTIIKNFHIIWVGVSSTADFYLGPFWTYLTSGLLYLSKGDPLITGYFAAFLGTVTTLIVYLVGSRLYGNKTGLLAALLYSSLPLIVYFDQKYWNVSLVPMLSLVLLLSIYSSRKNEKWWIVFALAYGLVFHIHLSLAPFGLVALIWRIRQKSKIQTRTYFLGVLAFLAVISPLIVFDYFHKWSNITFPARLVSNPDKESDRVSPLYKINALGQTLGRLVYLKPHISSADETNWGCTSMSSGKYFQNKSDKYWQTIDSITSRTTPPFLLTLSVIFALFWFLTQKALWLKDNTKLLIITITTLLACFLLFPGDAFDYYLIGLFPLLLFIPGILMDKASSSGKMIIAGTLITLSFLGVRTVVTSTNDYGLEVKRQLISEVVKVVGKESFELKSEGMCHIAEGWRYLFSIYGQKPVRSSTDQIFGWLYPGEILKDKAKYLVVMSESRVALTFSTANSIVVKKGGFSAYIFRN